MLERIRAVAAVEGVNADASLGLIDDPEIPEMLKEAGLVTYNHNFGDIAPVLPSRSVRPTRTTSG